MFYRGIKVTFTPHGIFVAFISLFMLLAAINYSNNAAYFIFFLIVSVSFVSGLYGFRSLWGLKVHLEGKAYAFAGSELHVKLSLSNENSEEKEFLECRLGNVPLSQKSRIIAPLAARTSHIHELAIPAPDRGVIHFECIKIQSHYPLGFFSFEKEFSIDLECLIYPKLESALLWPAPSVEMEDSDDEWSPSPGDSFAGHRPYTPGESQRHIDWKAYSRGKGLLIKDYRGGAVSEICFDYNGLKALDVEAKLSQLASWVVQAHEDHVEFTVNLLDEKFPASRGESHYRSIMRALALFPKVTGKV
ncbi:MAG: DUF58 domain-containing protein [Verrucomicrobiota bacterium]